MISPQSTPSEQPASFAAATEESARLDTVLLAVLGAVLLLAGLGSYPLWDPDEGRHAEIARRMAQEDRWLVPMIYGEPYYDKPSAFYWLERASFAVLGRTELAARLPSALATLATLVLLHRFAMHRLGRRAALLGGLVFLTMPEVVMLGRFCNLDAVLGLCVAAATFAVLARIDTPHRPPWAGYLAMGFGTLIKGPVAIVLPALTGLAAAVSRGGVWSKLRGIRPLHGGLIVAAVVLPWFALAGAADPAYIHTFLVEHNILRYTSPRFDHVEGPLFFGPVLLAVVFPWSLLLPAAIAIGRSVGTRHVYERDLAFWALVVVLFFSLGRAKLATYILPAMPAIALWLGSRLERLGRTENPPLGWLRFALVAWAVVFAILPIGAAVYTYIEHPDLLWAASGTLLLPLMAYGGVRAAWRRTSRVPLVFVASNAALFLGFYLLGGPFVSRVASDLSLAELAARLAPGVPAVGFRIQPASYSFYSDGVVVRADAPGEMPPDGPDDRLLIVTRRKYVDQLRASGTVLHEWADNGRHVLYGTFPRPDAAPPEPSPVKNGSPPC